MIKIYLLGINIILFTFLNCASYKYSVTESKIPISFGIDNLTQGKSRDFVIEAKISWFLFDLINLNFILLDKILILEFHSPFKFISTKSIRSYS